MRLDNFLCTCWSVVCLQWKNISLGKQEDQTESILPREQKIGTFSTSHFKDRRKKNFYFKLANNESLFLETS